MNGPWVAIIDDDACLCRSLARILQWAGIRAETFNSAEEYLGRPAGAEPRCVVLDINLGAGLNGFQLKERLASEGAAAPIIFMSGHDPRRFPSVGGADAANEFLRKPFDAETLVARVQRHLQFELSATNT